MNSFDKNFGRIGYSCIFESDMKVAWSNEKRLFKKIASSRIFTDAYSIAADAHEGFANLLTHNGIKFKAEFLPLPDRRYLCIAYPEDRFVRFACSEMYMRIFNIRASADKLLAAASAVKEALSEFDIPDDVIRLIEDQISFSESVKYDADSISRLFDTDRISDYVDIHEKFEVFRGTLKRFEKTLNKSVTLETDIKRPVAKICYDVFETALVELSRILYKCLPVGGKGRITIRETGNACLSVDVTADLNPDFNTRNIDYEVRDIKCAFEYLGGTVSVSSGAGGLVIRSAMPAPLSNHYKRIKTYTLDDVSEDNDDVILSGYSILNAGGREDDKHILQFNSPCTEPDIPLHDVLVDIMLSMFLSA